MYFFFFFVLVQIIHMLSEGHNSCRPTFCRVDAPTLGILVLAVPNYFTHKNFIYLYLLKNVRVTTKN